MKDVSQNFSCGNAVPTQFLMWERRSHAFPPHYTTACDRYTRSNIMPTFPLCNHAYYNIVLLLLPTNPVV